MINSLIKPPKAKNATVSKMETDQSVPAMSTTAQTAARFFVNGMGMQQRERFKQMLYSGAQCGQSIAESYGIPVEDFIKEIKQII